MNKIGISGSRRASSSAGATDPLHSTTNGTTATVPRPGNKYAANPAQGSKPINQSGDAKTIAGNIPARQGVELDLMIPNRTAVFQKARRAAAETDGGTVGFLQYSNLTGICAQPSIHKRRLKTTCRKVDESQFRSEN